MRRPIPPLCFLVALSGALLPAICRAQAAPAAAAPAAAPVAPDPLPVRRVTLFTSGVSYTERSGELDGDTSVPLQFRTGQVDDILKSMVLLDPAGQVRPATYTAHDPIGRTLQSFAVDVSQNLTEAQILGQLRGARVVVEAGGIVLATSTMTPKETLTGQIVGVETKPVALDKGNNPTISTVDVLTILGDAGLQSVWLDDVKSIRLLDDRLNRELHEALGLLATGADDQRRQVTLHFGGAGRRPVRVGYVTEAPLWKMSYRLVMGAAGAAAKPYLQGWALVENTSDDDWQDVRLSLVSGRPVSFIQNLYQPLYLPRPVVAPDVVASPYPQTHAGNMQDEAKKVADAQGNQYVSEQNGAGGSTNPFGRATDSGVLFGGHGNGKAPSAGFSGGFGGFGGGTSGSGGIGYGVSARGTVPTAASAATPAMTPAPTYISSADLAASVAAQAKGENAGELFQYDVTAPVTLPRQQAAMIPVVAQDVAGEKVSIYNPDVDARFPLNAFRIRNNTGLHLKGGPVTLFDGGTYAGDAKMEDIPPGDSRLVSYAVDLGLEGERQGPNGHTVETTYILKRGVMTITRRETQETTYTLKSRDDRARTVLVEHPFDASYKLVTPEKPAERTGQLYRFAVEVPAHKSEMLKVVTMRPVMQGVAILDVELSALAAYAQRKEVSQKLKDALQEVAQRRQRVLELRAQASSRDEEVKSVSTDQDRIRKNMGALDRASALYKRYVTELDAQETRIETLQRESARLNKEADAADHDLRVFVDGLTVE